MSKENKKSFFSTLGRWFRRMVLGASREMIEAEKNMTEEEANARARESDVEEIVTPFKQYVRGFLDHKLAVVALFIVVAMFLFVFIAPLFFPHYYDAYTETTQTNMGPNMRMMNVPAQLKKEGIRAIDGFGSFSVGLSETGNVYVWGHTILGTTKIDISVIPQEVKNANIQYVAAGFDHIIAIDDQGKVYGWGSNILGQFGAPGNERYSDSLYFSEIIPSGKIDLAHFKKLECGYQVSGILMDDGTLYLWGNGKSCNNLEKIWLRYGEGGAVVDDFAFTKNDMVVIIDGALQTAKADRYTTVRTAYGEAGKNLTEFLGNRKIVSVYADSSTVLFRLSDNSLCFAGDMTQNDFKQFPTLEEGEYFTKIAAASHHYSGVTNLGNAYSWGENTLGQCDMQEVNVPDADVFVGSYQTFLVNADRELEAKWGHGGYLFGTDTNGASVFQRLINGGRMTMTIGAIAVIISTIIGIIIGCVSGYFGGQVDIFLMRLAEIVSAIPFLPFAMILSTIMGRVAISENVRIFIIMVILGVLTWPGLAHMIRGQVLVVRENEYVTAAKAMGVKESKIAFKHILPNIISIIIVSLTLDFAGCMLTESSLSYLGFGVQAPRPTWGNMLNKANNSTVIQNYWWQWFFPALFLAVTTICINIVGDALRDVMDPKSTADR